MSVLISCEVGGEALPSQCSMLGTTARSNQARSNQARSGQAGAQHDRTAASKRTVGLKRSGRQPGRTKKQTTVAKPVLPDHTAMYVAQRMADYLRAPLLTNDYSRELIDVRRSLHHQQLFSKSTRSWSDDERQQLVETIYKPYRHRLRTKLGTMLSRSPHVIHLSVESFPLKSSPRKSTSRRTNNIRRADMGLLYDPSQPNEVDLCLDWVDEMYDEMEMLRVRRNYPQRGTRDSITRAMRSEFAGQNYIGIEMMVNQAWASRPIAIRDEVIDGICWALETVLEIPQSKAA